VRVGLDYQTKVNPRYETIFYGLRHGTEKNVAIVHPIAFLLRRLIYAFIIVFTPEHQTFYSLVTLASLSIMMAAFVIAEKPWRYAETNKQHLMNELAIYFTMVISFVFTDRSLDGFTADLLGMFMITFIIGVIAYNVYLISVECRQNFRLIYARSLNLKKAKLQRLVKEQSAKP